MQRSPGDCANFRRSVQQKLIQVLGVATVQLRRELGEPKASVARFNTPLEQATSTSPDALQMLIEGYPHSLLADFAGATGYYQRAAQIDTTLAMAYIKVRRPTRQLRDSDCATGSQRHYE